MKHAFVFPLNFILFLITGTPSNGQSKSASELHIMLASWVCNLKRDGLHHKLETGGHNGTTAFHSFFQQLESGNIQGVRKSEDNTNAIMYQKTTVCHDYDVQKKTNEVEL